MLVARNACLSSLFCRKIRPVRGVHAQRDESAQVANDKEDPDASLERELHGPSGTSIRGVYRG